MKEEVPERGEVVYLNSGSPAMTVIGYCAQCHLVEVEWMHNGLLERRHFPLLCLCRHNGLGVPVR